MITPPPSKNPLKHLHISDVRGAVQLAAQATTGVTEIVEGVHRAVWDTMHIPGGKKPGRTRGITGLAYRGVYGVTDLVGTSTEAVLALLEHFAATAIDAHAESPQREVAIAILNGVLGNHLADSDNPLAIPMSLRYRGEALNWQALPPMSGANGKVLLMIHGLCMNDLQWRVQQNGTVVDHGETVASTLGYTPIYLRYNSGLHISQNGRELSAQLEQLISHWPTPLEELSVLAHSMGGLVMRSAVHYGRQDALRWPDFLKKTVFLGTPHHGSPLERAGNWVDVILGSTPFTAPFAKLGHLRSAGITDLRHGHVLDEDWQGHDRFHRKPDSRQAVPLPADVACYTAAATTAAGPDDLSNHVIGDGLVPLHSALGRHKDERHSLTFAESNQWIGYRMRHRDLLGSPEVTEQLLRWLGEDS